MGDRILNITNFVRACEPRRPIDLAGTLKLQLALCAEYGYPSTALLQFDALDSCAFTDTVRAHMPLCEPGLWLEIVQPLCERAGIPWRGRFPWDWHANVGFLLGYPPEERERLVDACFARFREVFGAYPRSVGCWLLDAHSLEYMSARYGVEAACICQDQLAIDGYTLQGGVFRAGYYPSRFNALCPAATRENQISLPVFRMLGCDPIHIYDCPEVLTLEPACAEAGGNVDWCRWFLEQTVAGPCLSHTYVQAGQENSFGWPAMERGLRQQFALFRQYLDRGQLTLERLSQTGRRFSRDYALTPPSACVALSDWREEGALSVWMSCRGYRANLLFCGGALWLRDLYLMDERFPEKYLTARETSPRAQFTNLPVVSDGNGGRLAPSGLYAADREGEPLRLARPRIREEQGCLIADCGDFSVTFSEERIAFRGRVPWCLKFASRPRAFLGYQGEKVLEFSLCGYPYRLTLSAGTARGDLTLRPDENGNIVLKLHD